MLNEWFTFAENLTDLYVLGQRTTPSVVAFADDDTRHVGDVAKRQVSKEPLSLSLEGGRERAAFVRAIFISRLMLPILFFLT